MKLDWEKMFSITKRKNKDLTCNLCGVCNYSVEDLLDYYQTRKVKRCCEKCRNFLSEYRTKSVTKLVRRKIIRMAKRFEENQ